MNSKNFKLSLYAVMAVREPLAWLVLMRHNVKGIAAVAVYSTNV